MDEGEDEEEAHAVHKPEQMYRIKKICIQSIMMKKSMNLKLLNTVSKELMQSLLSECL